MERSPEVDETQWRRSRYCHSSTCVEVAGDGDEVLIRDGKAPQAPPLRYSRAEFAAFVAGVQAGDFDDLTRT